MLHKGFNEFCKFIKAARIATMGNVSPVFRLPVPATDGQNKKKQQQWGAKNLINCSPVEGKLQHQEQEQEQDQKVLPATGIPLQNSICSSSSSCPFGNHRRRSKSAWPNDFPVMPSLGQRKHNEVGWKEKMVGNLEQNRWGTRITTATRTSLPN